MFGESQASRLTFPGFIMIKNEFLICRIEKPKRYFLLRTISEDRGVITGFLEKDYHIPSRRMTVEVLKKDVICSLGTDPEYGSAYGVDLATFKGKKNHDLFGAINFLYKPSKEVGERLMQAFDRCAKNLKKQKLEFIADDTAGERVWEVRAPKGKWAGYYQRSKKPDVSPHRLVISPEKMTPSDYEYVIYHELGHHLHFNLVRSKKLNAKWIKIFNTTIKPIKVKKETSVALMDLLLHSENLPSEFSTELDEEMTIAYRYILKVIRADHSVTVKELDILFEERELEEIKSLWPQRTIVPSRDLKPIVSEYSTVSYKELFAEAFAFYMTGKKLPKEIVSLLEKSISYAKTKCDIKDEEENGE